MVSTNWVKELKPGDEVGITNNARISVHMATVERVTPSGQIFVDGRRFKAKDWGVVKEIGGSSFPETLLPKEKALALQESIQKTQQRRGLISLFRDKDWTRLSDEQLSQVKALIDSFTE